jgi:hypothetical protein
MHLGEQAIAYSCQFFECCGAIHARNREAKASV